MIYSASATPDIAKHLKAHKLIAYPTETVWGIGCDGFCESAIIKLLQLKNRPITKGLIVLTDDPKRILPFLRQLPPDRQDEILASWQDTTPTQATTWLFPLPPHTPIPHWLTGAHHSLAIRVIRHPAIAKICQSLVSDDNPYGFLVSTSCNPATLAPAMTLREAVGYFGADEGVIFLDDETLGYSKPSQIKDALTGAILRA